MRLVVGFVAVAALFMIVVSAKKGGGGSSPPPAPTCGMLSSAGLYYDLSSLNRSSGYTAVGGGLSNGNPTPNYYQYAVAFCNTLSGATCNQVLPASSSLISNIQACQAWGGSTGWTVKGNNAVCGITAGTTFSVFPGSVTVTNPPPSDNVVITASDGIVMTIGATTNASPRTTIVYVLCPDANNPAGELTVADNYNKGNKLYQLYWYNQVGCGLTAEQYAGANGNSNKSSGLSGGSIFLIIVFPLFALYCLIGVIFKRQRMGAVGLEMIPNIDLWRDLPFLVKDGFVFTFTRCPCCRGSYSKI